MPLLQISNTERSRHFHKFQAQSWSKGVLSPSKSCAIPGEFLISLRRPLRTCSLLKDSSSPRTECGNSISGNGRVRGVWRKSLVLPPSRGTSWLGFCSTGEIGKRNTRAIILKGDKSLKLSLEESTPRSP